MEILKPSLEEMRKRIARFQRLIPNPEQKVDSRLRNHRRELLSVIGHGVAEDLAGARISADLHALLVERLERAGHRGGGRLAVIEDFRRVRLFTEDGDERRLRLRGRGFPQTLDAWVAALTAGGPSPIAWPEIAAVTRATILAERSLREGVPLEV